MVFLKRRKINEKDVPRDWKTINGVKTEFILDGSNIIAETKNNNTQNYFYDESNNLYAIKHNGSMY